ncbi:hypothetical protein D3C76_1824430 [compost metagenome]
MTLGFIEHLAVQVLGLADTAFKRQAHAAQAAAHKTAARRTLLALSAFKHCPGLLEFALIHV